MYLGRITVNFYSVTGTRESAFVHAISTVGVSHAVTRSCSSGSFDQCGCDRTVWGKSRKGDFEWAGCSDNIAYGNAFSKTFVDARERTRGSHADRALMNLHNNNAGRQVGARMGAVESYLKYIFNMWNVTCTYSVLSFHGFLDQFHIIVIIKNKSRHEPAHCKDKGEMRF